MCNLVDMEIVNDEDHASDRDQYTFQSSIDIRHRIDFILHSKHLRKLGAGAVDDLDLGSDHRTVHACFQVKRPSLRIVKRKKKMRGWKPPMDDDRIASSYHANLDSISCTYLNPSLADISRIATQAASITPSSIPSPNFGRPEQSDKLKAMMKDRHDARWKINEQKWSKSIVKLARQDIRAWRSL